MNLDEQQDNFWREGLALGVNDQKGFMIKYQEFVQSIQQQVAHLPQAEQDILVGRLVARNSEYIALGKTNREALKARLGVASPDPMPNNLGQIAVETAVRATVWQGIAAIFRLFR